MQADARRSADLAAVSIRKTRFRCGTRYGEGFAALQSRPVKWPDIDPPPLFARVGLAVCGAFIARTAPHICETSRDSNEMEIPIQK
jgi:hypothetical protein